MNATDGFIDLHFHILPGVDDGAKDMTIALEMARLALVDGVKTIVATPHPNADSGIGSKAITTKAVVNFNAVLHEHGLDDLEVVPGVECYLVPEIVALLKQEKLFTLNNSRYVLIEFNHVVAPVKIDLLMFRLRSEGFVPIIAHPERYKYMHDNLDWLLPLVRMGCLTQITAGSFYGRFGKRCQKTAQALLKHNLAHVVASDAHNTGLRSPGLSLARPIIERIAGKEVFEEMAVGLPGKILANVNYTPLAPERVTARVFWKFW